MPSVSSHSTDSPDSSATFLPPRSGKPWREALLLAAWLLSTLALRPLLLPDEGRYAGVAWEMLHGSPLVPRLDGLPFFHKPPLLYWLDLGALQLLGAHAFAARLGPALLGFALAWALFLHLRRRHGLTVARIGVVVLATSPLFFFGAQYVNHDIGVAACITAAVLAAARALDEAGHSARRWVVAAWALCGLGFLAKGLIGIVLPAFVVGPWLIAQRRWRDLLRLVHPLGIAAFAVVVLPWAALMQSRYPGFFDYFIVEQHFRRFTGDDFNNRMPGWFYLVVLPLLMLPWSAWLTRLRPALGAGAWRKPEVGLYLWWIVAIVGFFSLPASKLVGYVMPALAPMAALVALVLSARANPWPRIGLVAALWCAALLGLLVWKSDDSQREIGRALAAAIGPGDRVAFIDEYDYAIPFAARLPSPPVVVSDWTAPDIALHDNWRKELADAARFDPERASRQLWNWPQLGALDCNVPRVWIVSDASQRGRLAAALPGLVAVMRRRQIELLSAPGRTCAKTP